MKKEEKEILTKKAQFFLEKNSAVHIACKNSRFYNGYIKEISADFLIIKELNNSEQPIFFLEIIAIEEYILRENRVK